MNNYSEYFGAYKDVLVKIKQHPIFYLLPIIILYFFFDSSVHYYLHNDSILKTIPSNTNKFSIECAIPLFFVSFFLFTTLLSYKKLYIPNKSENISRAKKQWELAVDSLPQLVIAIDNNSKITRVNKTIETWGLGKVDKVKGLSASEFIKQINKDCSDGFWNLKWIHIWKQLEANDFIKMRINCKETGKVFNYTLRKISDHKNNNQCYAILVIDDITTQEDTKKTLLIHTQDLEKRINIRTSELKESNKQLKHELQIQKTAKIALKKSQECRLGLLRDLFSSQEIERKRIACELHDSIGQSLGAAKFKIEEFLINKENIKDEYNYTQIKTIVDTLKNSIDEVRHIAMDLRPAILDDLGILPTLQWFCREFKNTYTGINIDLSLNVVEPDISDDKKVVIFRIVQESMNNIAKHGCATNIVVEINKSIDVTELCISDNGCGFDMDTLTSKNTYIADDKDNQPRCNFGLRSMRERAESTNGKFSIESISNRGTSITVSWKT